MQMTLNTHQQLVQNLLARLRTEDSDVDLVETHISSVLLVGDNAYKIKKPLDLGFLDFSTLKRRRYCCEEEVRLNRRLAPDIYRELVVITGSLDDPRIGGTGEPLEYAVHMRRFSREGLLSDNPAALNHELVTAMVHQLAAFHAQIERAGPDGPYGSPDEVYFPMAQNFEQIRAMGGTDSQADRLDLIEHWTRDAFQRLRPLLAQRKAGGFVRECHGDLHLGNITLENGQLVVFDGIEFNPELRWIDTMSELAFLLMDMEEHGLERLARQLLNQYLEISGDYQGVELLRFYQVYRAMVRAKISAIRMNQTRQGSAEYSELEQLFREYLARALAFTGEQPRMLLLTHGLSGSGKSTLAAALVEAMPLLRLRSDVERKRLIGLDAAARTDSGLEGGIYTADMTEKTYQRLLILARTVLRAGFGAVIDATFLRRSQRMPFQQLAQDEGVPFLILDMQLPLGQLRARVAQRQAEGKDASEADLAVLEAQIDAREELDEAELPRSRTMDSDLELGVSILARELADLES